MESLKNFVTCPFTPEFEKLLAKCAKVNPTADPLPVIDRPASQIGAVASFSQKVLNLSSRFGALGEDVAGLHALFETGASPKDYFNKILDLDKTRLLGVIPLSNLLAEGALTGDGDIPTITARRLDATAAGSTTVGGYETEVLWKPRCRACAPISFNADAPQPLTLRSAQRCSAAGSMSLIHGELSDFTISFAEIVEISVATLYFEASAGTAPVFRMDGVDVTFLGPLRFLSDLAKQLKGIFGNGISVDLRPEALAIDLQLAIPPLSIGVFAFQDLRADIGLRIPFDGHPARLHFQFNRREAPCLVAVSIIGGGAYLNLETGLDKVQSVEAAIEMGGAVALNLGVASGSVEAMAGIYFRLDQSGSQETVTFGGYYRCGGCLEILAVVSVSVQFYLLLTLELQSGSRKTISGEASVTITVRVAFFSKSVSLSIRKTFSGSDPTFPQLMRPDDWMTYCEAFRGF